MKLLLIMRHAKSSWGNSEHSDFERPLNKFGLKSAPFMGNLIYNYKLHPDLILSSPAKRAKQTAILIKAVAEIKAKIEYREELYGARPNTFFEITSELADKLNSALLIGHNPELENFIYNITGDRQSMPTASIAVIRLNISTWKEISPNCGNLEFIIRPKELMERVEIFQHYNLIDYNANNVF